MPSVRSVQTNVGGVRTALALGSSSSPTLLLTFGASLLGPDGVSGIGALIDRILVMPSSSQAADRIASFFLTSSSSPSLGPSYQVGRERAPVGVPPVVIEGPYRGKSNYQVWGFVDSTAADVYATIEGSEIY